MAHNPRVNNPPQRHPHAERLAALIAHAEHQAKHGAPVSQHLTNELRAIKAWYDNQNATGDNT